MTWNNKPDNETRSVIDAFLLKEPKRKGDFYTDGVTYQVHGFAIAKHVEVPVSEAVAYKLMTNADLVRLAFRFGRYNNPVITNHLDMFFKGLDVHWYGDKPMMNGKEVEPDTWYTLEQLAAMPEYVAPEYMPKPRANARRDDCTMELFPA